MSATRPVIRQAIQQVLREHVEEPFLLIREAGLQARLWGLLRQNLTPMVVHSQIKAKHPLHRHTREFQTSRVQLELKVGGTLKSDIVIFRADRGPRLTCWAAGPTDVVAAVVPDDVEAVIEMKASPSRAREQREAFAEDITKLADLSTRYPHIECYFVLVDKSLSVAGATCDPSQADENWPLEPSRILREGSGANDGNLVEVWDLACGPDPRPRVRYLE
jgi:hypothetical protein